jgi:hypothetical protein
MLAFDIIYLTYLILLISILFPKLHNPSGCSVYGVGLRPLVCWYCGFESRWQQGCLSFASVVRYMSALRADLSSRGVQTSVVCLSVIVNPQKRGGPRPLGAVAPWAKPYAAPRQVLLLPHPGYGCPCSVVVSSIVYPL